jgi:hypothetical protein
MSCPKYTPPGYAPCTRDPDHDGPCAHPLAIEGVVIQAIIDLACPNTIIDHGARQAWERGRRDALDAVRALGAK